MIDFTTIRENFPILDQDLIYFDNAATSATCIAAIETMDLYNRTNRFSIHRGVYDKSIQSEMAYESTRKKVRDFINASSESEIVFTGGATDGLNMVAGGYLSLVDKEANIVVTELEHHSNYLPWKRVCQITGCEFRVAKCNHDGLLSSEAVLSLVDNKTSLVAITASSNVTGIVQDLGEIIEFAHEKGALVLVDASQLCSHRKIDVTTLNCDYLCFSTHKMFGPTGCGVLYGKYEALQKLPPGKVGGGMVHTVGFGKDAEKWNPIPQRFEAGTPALTEVVGLGATLDYLQGIDWNAVHEYEQVLTVRLIQKLGSLKGVFVCGGLSLLDDRLPLVSFSVSGVSSYDLGLLLSAHNIAVRTGSLCAQLLLRRVGQDSVVRVSLSFYNTLEEVDTFFEILSDVLARLGSV
jgi:cysteine desulfurase/selenocysteine lyase